MNYLEKNIEQYKKDLAGLIKIDSWLRSENEYPFPQAKQALEYMIGLAKRDGMEVTYVDEQGYYGYIEIGQGEELIGFLGHLDVVPAGELSSWNSNPFEMIEKDGKLFGRGTQDDKGPVMLSYYLMKELFEEGNLNKRVRLILATDEESFWRGIDKYKADGQEVLDYGIAPDSMFPVTYSERGLLQYKITSTDFPTNFSLTGGSAFNAVADVAEYKSGETSIKELGKPAHAMEPWKGDNAINKIISQINEDHGLVKFAKEVLNNEIDGQTLMGKLIQDDDAPLTVNLGKVSINDKEAWLGLDSRLPNTITLEEFESKITEAVKPYGLTYERYDWLQPVFIPKDSQVIKDLMETYREITGDNTPEKASGGATYARAMENVVAFGPLFSYSEITEHQPNEHITIEEFIKVYDIYYKSFKKWLSH